MNIVFAGTPEFGLPCLEALAASSHKILAVYTQPDRPKGRGRQLQASPIKQWAINHHISVQQPQNFKDAAAVETLRAFAPDLMVVIAYGLILPQSILDIPQFGCINVHASLLPRWRGAAPIQHAILQGDKETGITIMQMDKGLDTGAMLMQVPYTLTHETSEELHNILAELATNALLTSIDAIAQNKAQPKAQKHDTATYAHKIQKEDALINWQLDAQTIEHQVRAFNPWPIAYTQTQDCILRIHQVAIIPCTHHEKPGTILNTSTDGILVATGKDALLLQRIQSPGAKVMSAADWLRGSHHTLPTIFESIPVEKK